MQSLRPVGEFWGDLKKAVGAWRVVPALPLMTLALQLPFALQKLHPLWGLPMLFLALFYVGFVGTERIWYQRIWNNDTLTARQVWVSAWSYFGRYLGLVLLLLIPYLVLMFILGIALGALFNMDASLARTVNAAVLAIVWDVAMTFMTPALAFSTSRPQEAIRIGLTFLREQGRKVALYALAPPLVALALLQRTPSTTLPGGPRVLLALVGTQAYLALKGATAAKYLRHHEVDETALPEILTERGTARAAREGARPAQADGQDA